MRVRTLLSVCAFALAPLISVTGCSEKQEAGASAAKPALTVQVVQPRQASWPSQLAASGSVAAWQEASIGTELAGVRLEEVRANVGDAVTRGQLLARFDEASMRADLAQLDAGVAEARAMLDKARLDAESADQLEGSGAISRHEARGIKTQAAIAEARLASAQAQRNAQALRLGHARVLAPDDGVISARLATVGAVASPGMELFRLIRGNRLEWRAEVRTDVLAQIQPGVRAEIQLPAGGTVEGSVRQAAPSVSPDTLNGIVYVDLPSHPALAAGMFLSGRFEVGSTSALAVPESALVFRAGNRYVMQVGEDGRIREIKVQVGRRQGTDVEIIGGVTAGSRLALSGGAFLNDGDLVRVAKP